jgi:Flp pilus assembly protein TadD
VNFGMLLPDVDTVRMELDTRNRENSLSASALRALELADLVTLADDALVQGNLEQARQEYMRALELAPRHRDLVLIVAEIDFLAGGREHAALGLISETLPTIAAGRIAAELLQILGDKGGADEALDAAIRSERYAPLRALLQLRKATFDSDVRRQMEVLDAAVAAAPTLSVVRWVRFESRAKRGDSDGALADAQYLETCATGSRSKFDVCMRCGLALFEAGLGPQASRFFERALRYRPDDPKAAVGLARSFLNVGQANRAISLLERAIVASDSVGQVDPHAQLLLACLLVKQTADLPQAIARVRQISAGSDVAVEARLWEARWRLALGDIVGTSVAWARMRELIELGHQTSDAAKWLVEAAMFEREIRHDLVCAERHLAIALRVAPHDSGLDSLYREVATSLATSVPQTQSPSTREPK